MIVIRNVFQLKSKPRFVARVLDHELWMAFFRDPYGNPLELMGEVRRA